MDKLKAMQTFVHIADAGSLTAAARVCDSSLPAVVRTLAALEAHLGVRLFHRTTRRISLTEEGKRYLDNCRAVLAAVDDAEAALSADAAEPSGQLTLTAPVLFGQMYVAPAVMRFVQRYERVRCSLVLQDRIVNLLEEGLDAGIRIGHLEDSSLVAQPLSTLRRVVVAIDPAVSSEAGADETGIIVAGLGEDGHGYILADLSGRYRPDQWAKQAIAAYHAFRADRIIGEVNNGGELIGATLRTNDPNIAFKAVHASRGKRLRAEPVAALYEQGRVRHHGRFPQLEDQMTNWEPNGAGPSPDRLDAAVWALTELMLDAAATPRLRSLGD